MDGGGPAGVVDRLANIPPVVGPGVVVPNAGVAFPTSPKRFPAFGCPPKLASAGLLGVDAEVVPVDCC